jgi:hypothetical protein
MGKIQDFLVKAKPPLQVAFSFPRASPQSSLFRACSSPVDLFGVDGEQHLGVLVVHLPGDVGRVGGSRQCVGAAGVPRLVCPAPANAARAQRRLPERVPLAPFVIPRQVSVEGSKIRRSSS